MTDTFLQFLSLDFPKQDPPRYGFLEITNQRHRETVNSAIYGHFLSQDRNETIANLFKDTLLALIEARLKPFSSKPLNDDTEVELAPRIEDFTVELEVQTNKSNRIDLVLRDNTNKTAIIIENKIYHFLANDLQDYWDSIEDSKKVGVLLTLTKESVPSHFEGQYVNILHKEWIDAIKQTGLPPDLDIRDYVYLNDFFFSLLELSNTNTMNDQSTFFFQHQSKILEARDIYYVAYDHVQNALKTVVAKNNYEAYGKNTRYMQFWPEGLKHELYYTIVFEDLLEPKAGERPSLLIIIEIAKDLLGMIDEFDQLTRDKTEFSHLAFKQVEHKGFWMHYASKHYYPTIEEISKLHDFIDNKIEKDFSKLFEAMLGLVEAKKA